jgi:lipid II:glycine glycyltransferase (peptidoglycan interpeptide bridge formation enzyme)
MNIWKPYNEGREKWNEFILSSPNDFRQSFDWGEYLKFTGWKLNRIALYEDMKIIAAVQYTYRKMWPFLVIYLPSGISGNNEYLKSFIKNIKKEYKLYFIYLRIDVRNKDNNSIISILKSLKFKQPIYSIRSRIHQFVSFKDDCDQILKNAKQKWRYNYRQAIKKDINLNVVDDINPEEIYHLSKELSKFKGIKHPYSYKQLEEFKKHLKKYAHIIRASDHNSKVIGYHICIIHNDMAYQVFNGVNADGNKLMAGYSILIFVIESLRKYELKYMDIGEINEKRYPGNYQFKRGFNQNYIKVVGEYEWASNVLFKYFINLYMYLINA